MAERQLSLTPEEGRRTTNEESGASRFGAVIGAGGTGRRSVAPPRTTGGRDGGRSSGPASSSGRRPLPATNPGIRLPQALLGAVVVVGCALGAVYVHAATTSTRQAVVLAHPVARGHVFEASDFAAASVSAQGMRLVPYAARDRLIGRFAVTDLDTATPLTDSLAVTATPLAGGDGLVGRRLVAGEYPVGLAAGDHVQVVLVVEAPPVAGSSAGATAGAPPVGADPAGGAVADTKGTTHTSVVLAQPAVVEAVEAVKNSTDAQVVTLRLPSDLAQQVAAADGVRLVQVKA